MPALQAKPSQRQLERSVAEGMRFLRGSQLPHGEFRCCASPDPGLRDACQFDSSPFATACILYSLGTSQHSMAGDMMAKGLDFLQAEMEGPGLWRYWSSRNARHAMLPPDLDDTCCISYLLKQYGRRAPDNRDVILANRDSRGLFYTWVVPRAQSTPGSLAGSQVSVKPQSLLALSLAGELDDIDCVVNANALLYLGDSVDTAAAALHLSGLIVGESEKGCSRFYPDALSFYYAASRALRHGARSLQPTAGPIARAVLLAQHPDGSFGNELLTALAACTLLNLDQRVPALERAVEYILTTQGADGSWRRLSMWLGPAPYYGCEELTTALCIEALSGYNRLRWQTRARNRRAHLCGCAAAGREAGTRFHRCVKLQQAGSAPALRACSVDLSGF